ncbi:hypothetical protein C6A87_026540 [Mycobacterium sp. ITM-2016-00317]|uniref:hypothetical protein n=1 Tax=Mycobacterium sp. ITM-2016-00317 TaxID=2099694 RepID=UPI000D4C62A2|nr:hypothetical protein [Mycobacterium sp. ITM-2016-00317]WNG87276.1 hypothetical protein C6A87_026540 [Mycobacterium sp. ITM-2016-00317]
MKWMAAWAIAGVLAAPLTVSVAGPASATPSTCDGAGCVPFVAHDAQLGERCNQKTRYNFGLDGSGNTLACNSKSQWVSFPPLVGVRTLRSVCGDATGVAQSPDGVPLKCDRGAWSADYWVMFYG